VVIEVWQILKFVGCKTTEKWQCHFFDAAI
jgi:hypothetical protein